jgi:hypothetical protein
MTKKDYQAIGAAIWCARKNAINQGRLTQEAETALDDLVEVLCEDFKRDNHRFDACLFRKFADPEA